MTSDPSPFPPFKAPYAPDDGVIAARLLETARLNAEQDERIDRTATRLIDAIRAQRRPARRRRGHASRVRALHQRGSRADGAREALLRVPDARTADQFIEDKLGQGDFVHHETKSSAFLVNASAWALGMSARVIQPGETPQGTIGRLAKRLGVPAVRAATRQAMRLMGSHFVLGETIESALERAQPHSAVLRAIPSTCSAKARAPPLMRSAISIPTPARSKPSAAPPMTGPADRPGISVKLSALHRVRSREHQR